MHTLSIGDSVGLNFIFLLLLMDALQELLLTQQLIQCLSLNIDLLIDLDAVIIHSYNIHVKSPFFHQIFRNIDIRRNGFYILYPNLGYFRNPSINIVNGMINVYDGCNEYYITINKRIKVSYKLITWFIGDDYCMNLRGKFKPTKKDYENWYFTNIEFIKVPIIGF